MLTPQRDPAAEKLLGAPATSRRDFSRAETLSWMTEIYDNSPAKQPKQFDVSARLLDQTGREAFASRDLLKNGEAGAPKWQTFAYTGRIPLTEIPPGDTCCGSRRSIEASRRDNRSAAQTVITVR